jgi:hypothetical protein
MGEMRNALKILVRKCEKKRSLGRYILRWHNTKMILKKWGMRMWTRFIWLKVGSSGRLL